MTPDAYDAWLATRGDPDNEHTEALRADADQDARDNDRKESW